MHKIMKEKIISDHLSFMIEDRSNFFHKLFNRKMQQLVEAGIARKIVADFTTVNFADGAGTPMILTLDHFEIWFVIWLYGLLVAFLVFVVEFLLRNKKNS